MKRREILVAGASILSTPAWVSAQSSAWPTRGPIRLVAQFPPGGLVDTVSRLMAPHLSQALGQSVVVDNKAGAGGLIGTDYVSKQPADGYTLLVSHASVHVYATATRKVMPFDPIADFTHVGMLVEAPMVLLVRAQSPYQTLAQYVDAAKTKPVKYGSSGIGSANHLFGEMLKIEGKAPQHDHIPYQGSAPAMQDLLGGNIDSLFDPVTTNVAQLKAGSLRALAVSTPNRLPALPNIPTFAELGYPAVQVPLWVGVMAPRGTPDAVVNRLHEALIAAVTSPPVRQLMDNLGAEVTAQGPAPFGEMIREDFARWAEVIRRGNIRAD